MRRIAPKDHPGALALSRHSDHQMKLAALGDRCPAFALRECWELDDPARACRTGRRRAAPTGTAATATPASPPSAAPGWSTATIRSCGDRESQRTGPEPLCRKRIADG